MSGKSSFAGFDEKQNNGFGIRAEHIRMMPLRVYKKHKKVYFVSIDSERLPIFL